MLLRLEFEVCLSTGAECYIYGLDNLHLPGRCNWWRTFHVG